MAEQNVEKKTYQYPSMHDYLRPLANPGKRKIVGRQDTINLILATLNRDEISNVALVGEAGTGKTTVAYAVSELDRARTYYEVRLSLMSSSDNGADGTVQMASRLTRLVDEVIAYQKTTNRQVVLFMDEFHLIMEISPAAVEAIKPILANSGARGVKIIVATTLEEFNTWIRPNEALTERLERITLPELTFDETLTALVGSVKTHLSGEYVDERLLRRLIEVTNQALPSQKQPRKSLRLLDAMIGWHKTFHDPMNDSLMAKMMKASVGVDVDYQVNVDKTEEKLNARVFDQTTAVRAIADRLYVSVADLNDRTRPRGSFLFTGPTGSGKTELCKAIANLLFGSDTAMIRFDMSEYAEDSTVGMLKDAMTEKLWETPSCVLLLDEIEKAAAPCVKLMLQALDDARMTDEHGREISFKDAYIIFTTNAGANIYRDVQAIYGHAASTVENDEDEQRRQRKFLREYMPLITRALRAKESQFPPELLGRFDQIVPFAGIGESTRYKICKMQLDKLVSNVFRKHGVRLHIDHDVERFIVEEHVGSNSTDNGGGREIRRRIDQNVVSKVAEVVIKYPKIKDLAVGISGKMAIDQHYDKEGSAEVVVGKWAGTSK